jgi:multicomponent Na+:H+ antiporter subunit D
MIALVLVPLGAGAALFVLRGAGRALLGPAAALATLAAAAALAAEVLAAGPQRHAVGGWGAPLGIELHADGLSAVMLLMTALAGLATSVYALAYFPPPRPPGEWDEGALFWPLWLLLWAALNALFLSGDLFNLYVVLEVATLAAVGLAALAEGREAARAALRYLLAALTGSMAYLMGFGLLYAAFHTLDLRGLAAVVTPGPAAALALSLMTAGLVLKTALFPLHFWLPPAHAAAPAPVSAVLSGLVVKGSFYVLLRLWLDVAPEARGAAAGQLLGMLGAAAIVWGSFQAMRQRRLKMLVAYSTVGQIGYLFLVFPLLLAGASPPGAPGGLEAWVGGVYQALSHGLAKAALFLAAGVIMHAMGGDELAAMRDVAGRLPLATFALALAGTSLIGLPPSGGFVAKWMLMKAVIASGQWWWLPVIVGGGLLTAGYVFLMLRHTFVPGERGRAPARVPLGMQLSALALAASAVVMGLRLEEPLALLRVGGPFSGGAP